MLNPTVFSLWDCAIRAQSPRAPQLPVNDSVWIVFEMSANPTFGFPCLAFLTKDAAELSVEKLQQSKPDAQFYVREVLVVLEERSATTGY